MWLIPIAVFLVVVLAVAAWSDRNDRRSDVDPRTRAKLIGDRRRQLRQDRAERLTKRLSSRSTARRPDKPWER